MKATVLNYRIIVEPDERTGTGEPCFTAYCPTLGVADGGDTIDEALKNVQEAMELYVECLIDDGKPVPIEQPDLQTLTTAKVTVHKSFNVVN